MPRNDLVLEDVRIVFRNFSGAPGMYNKEGDRNFAVLLDRDLAQQLANEGWNIKQLRPRDEEEEPQPYLSVAVEFDKGRPPTIVMISSKGRTQLGKDDVEVLDFVDIGQIDMILNPYDWEVNGNKGRKAYLASLYVTIIEDPLELKYGNTAQIATVEGPMMERTDPLGAN